MIQNIGKHLAALEDFQESQIVHEEAPVVTPDIDAVTPLPETTQELEVEQTIDHDDTMSMIEHTRVEQTVVEDQVDNVLQAQYALEQYAVLLKQAGIDGISRQAAAVMAVGLKQINSVVPTGDLTAGLEGYDATPRSAIQRATTVSMEDIKEKAKEVYEKFKELIKRLIEQMLDGINNLTTGITKTEMLLSKLDTQAKATKNRNMAKVTFPVASPGSISVNGEVELSTRSLSGLAGFATHVYPNAVAKYYAAISDILKNYSVTSGVAEETIELINKEAAPLDGLYGDETIFPGNMEVDIDSSGLVYGLRQSERAKPNPESYDHQVRSLGDIRKALVELSDIIKIIKRARDEAGAIKTGAALLLERTSKMEKTLEDASMKDKLDQASFAEADKVLKHAMSMVRKSNPRNREILVYIARTVMAYALIIQHELKAYVEISE